MLCFALNTALRKRFVYWYKLFVVDPNENNEETTINDDEIAAREDGIGDEEFHTCRQTENEERDEGEANTGNDSDESALHC